MKKLLFILCVVMNGAMVLGMEPDKPDYSNKPQFFVKNELAQKQDEIVRLQQEQRKIQQELQQIGPIASVDQLSHDIAKKMQQLENVDREFSEAGGMRPVKRDEFQASLEDLQKKLKQSQKKKHCSHGCRELMKS